MRTAMQTPSTFMRLHHWRSSTVRRPQSLSLPTNSAPWPWPALKYKPKPSHCEWPQSPCFRGWTGWPTHGLVAHYLWQLDRTPQLPWQSKHDGKRKTNTYSGMLCLDTHRQTCLASVSWVDIRHDVRANELSSWLLLHVVGSSKPPKQWARISQETALLEWALSQWEVNGKPRPFILSLKLRFHNPKPIFFHPCLVASWVLKYVMKCFCRCLPSVAYTYVLKPSHLQIEAFVCQGGAAEVTDVCVFVCVCVGLAAMALTMLDWTRRSAQRST